MTITQVEISQNRKAVAAMVDSLPIIVSPVKSQSAYLSPWVPGTP
jgi:hypothetical protein